MVGFGVSKTARARQTPYESTAVAQAAVLIGGNINESASYVDELLITLGIKIIF
jgi:hypothetical protein